MKQTFMRSCLCLTAVLALAIAIAARPVSAATINVGTLAAGSSYSNTISSNGPTFSNDYDFHLDATVTGLTILATAISQTGAGFGVDSMTIKLLDSSSNVIASATGAPLVGFDSFHQSGIPLGAGDYVFTVFGNVTSGMKAFVSISLAANNLNGVPIPATGLMLLTGLAGLGGIAWRRRRSTGAPPSLAA